jgi:hypothetical protein
MAHLPTLKTSVSLSRAFKALLLLPFVVMSLFAPGVMPTRGADGGMQVVLCSPDGPVNVTIGPDGQPQPAKDHPSDDRCDWAVGRADLALADLPILMEPVTLGLPMGMTDLWAEHRPAHDPRGIYARGPPNRL